MPSLRDTRTQPIVMTIDTKKPRLRIFKATVHQMGDPKFIQLMINPESRLIALRGMDRHTPGQLEIRVDQQVANTEDCVDWYSTALVAELCAAFHEIESGNSYNLTGTLFPKERAVVFKLSGLTLIESNMGVVYV